MKTIIRYVCPICGEESVYADDNVTMYWNVAAQAWEASDGGIPDERTTLYCGDCGEESTVAEAKEVEEAKNVELEVWSKWSVMIPATFCETLDDDTVEALIAMLHKHGAGETVHYAHIIAEYHTEYHGDTVVTGAVAFALCKAALTEMFPDLSITQEEPDDPVQAYLKRMAERGDDEAKSLLA